MKEKEIIKLKEYKYGFSTDIENIKAPKGLNEDVIKFISNIKKEPKWLYNGITIFPKDVVSNIMKEISSGKAA